MLFSDFLAAGLVSFFFGFSAGALFSLTADFTPVISSIISYSRGSTSYFAGAAFLLAYGLVATFLVSFFLTDFALFLTTWAIEPLLEVFFLSESVISSELKSASDVVAFFYVLVLFLEVYVFLPPDGLDSLPLEKKESMLTIFLRKPH